MQITPNSIETMAGPSEWFTGAVYVDPVAAPSDQSRLQALLSVAVHSGIRDAVSDLRHTRYIRRCRA